ncbi:MAG TPA: sigma 54-interacting transcriptional regulator [Polyangiaceae bacterium]|jgi:two-component system nitrogen regulation response regulator GlnG|nr:sigma 54-interacting transcriptional regulator [Polyangiaceae bacterium]
MGTASKPLGPRAGRLDGATAGDGGATARGETELNEAPRTAARGVPPRFLAIGGPGMGSGLAITGSFATVGRHRTNDLVLADPRVSAVHLEVMRSGTRVRVRDAASTNGTWLGPHRIVEMEIAPGAEITVGGTVLRLDEGEEAASGTGESQRAFGDLVGGSPPMRELFAVLERIAPKNLTVLVQGETGTGKEEVARAIHRHSPRAKAPFVVVDATALPQSLAESLLFGHEKGAFTGADHRRIGLFEAAEGGTIFLDEIGELPAELQAKFLRVLERREITRVGATAPVKIDVRVLAATHRDLRREIEHGRFREDLYFRLAQVRVLIAPLRERLEDVPILCTAFLQELGAPGTIDADAMADLQARPWPGNVRELRNVIARAAALTSEPAIRRTDIAGEGFGFRGTRDERAALVLSGPFAPAKAKAIERFERAYLTALMRRCRDNLSHAAREADLARHHLRELLKKRDLYAVDPSGERSDGENDP